MNSTVYLYLFGAVTIILCTFAVAQIEVTTYNGKVKGISRTQNGNVSYEFRGIPYAKPPVDTLRFKKPEPVTNWNETRDATQFGNSCWQVSYEFPVGDGIGNMSEDCLTLNIYVPGNLTVNRAVMVWIHGGGYLAGAGREYGGQELAVYGDVIIVTINYRLGIFGFGSTGDSTLPGNLGMWDQVMALKWIKMNIGRFGGDNSRITIFGESAGSGSVNLLSIAPQTKGLYQRVIGQSGAALSPWAVTSKEDALWALTSTANTLNCPTDSNIKMVECLGKVDAELLQNASTPFSVLPYVSITFAPVVDGDFLIEEPRKTFQDKTSEAYQLFASLNYMSGFNTLEGMTMMLRMDHVIAGLNVTGGLTRHTALNSTARMADFLTPKGADVNAVDDALVSVYCKDSETDKAKLGLNIMHMYGDVMMLAPTVEVMNSRDQSPGKTYVYNFGYFRPNNTLRSLPSSYYTVPLWARGAAHFDEVVFVFGLDIYKNKAEDKTFTAHEAALSSAMMSFWTNFAKTGNPGSGWAEYDSINKRYMDIDITQTMKANIVPERMELFLKTLPDIYARKPSSTMQPTTGSRGGNLQISVYCLLVITLIFNIF